MKEIADLSAPLETGLTGTKIVFWYEEFALYGFICTLPLASKFNTPFVILLALCWLLNRRFKVAYSVLRNNWIFYSLAIYYIVNAFSLLYTSNTHAGNQSLETKLPFLFVPVLMSGFVLNATIAKRIMQSYVLAMVVISLSSMATVFYHYGTAYDFAFFSYSLSDFVGPSPNHYAIFIAFALIFLMIGMVEMKLFSRSISILLFVYLLGFLGILSSRMAIIAFVLISTLFLLRTMIRTTDRRVKIISIASIFFIIASISIAVLTVPYLHDRVTQMTKGFENDPRYNTMRASVNLIEVSPWIGYGVGDVQENLNKEYERIGFKEGLNNEYNPHNDWLNAFLSVGIVGVLALSMIYVFCLRSAIKVTDFFKVAILLMYMLTSQTETIFNRNKGVLLFSFMISLVFIQEIGQVPNRQEHV